MPRKMQSFTKRFIDFSRFSSILGVCERGYTNGLAKASLILLCQPPKLQIDHHRNVVFEEASSFSIRYLASSEPYISNFTGDGWIDGFEAFCLGDWRLI